MTKICCICTVLKVVTYACSHLRCCECSLRTAFKVCQPEDLCFTSYTILSLLKSPAMLKAICTTLAEHEKQEVGLWLPVEIHFTAVPLKYTIVSCHDEYFLCDEQCPAWTSCFTCSLMIIILNEFVQVIVWISLSVSSDGPDRAWVQPSHVVSDILDEDLLFPFIFWVQSQMSAWARRLMSRTTVHCPASITTRVFILENSVIQSSGVGDISWFEMFVLIQNELKKLSGFIHWFIDSLEDWSRAGNAIPCG